MEASMFYLVQHLERTPPGLRASVLTEFLSHSDPTENGERMRLDYNARLFTQLRKNGVWPLKEGTR